MTRSEMLMAALAAGGENVSFTPVQVQKLCFLLDREAAHLLEGPHFNFAPYDYGPFDRAVYDGLDSLARGGMARIENAGRYRVYALTHAGFQSGTALMRRLPAGTQDYLVSMAAWVRELNFEQLVAAIYNRYPEMKINSVFRG